MFFPVQYGDNMQLGNETSAHHLIWEIVCVFLLMDYLCNRFVSPDILFDGDLVVHKHQNSMGFLVS